MMHGLWMQVLNDKGYKAFAWLMNLTDIGPQLSQPGERDYDVSQHASMLTQRTLYTGHAHFLSKTCLGVHFALPGVPAAWACTACPALGKRWLASVLGTVLAVT